MSKSFLKVRNGISFPGLSAAPSDPQNGDLYYNTSSNTFQQYLNGSWVSPVTSSLIGAANGIASLDSSGLIPIAQIPPAALERMSVVANQASRYALTTATVQNGDSVYQTDTATMYMVIDQTNLSNSAGYQVYSAGTAVNFSGSLAGDVSGTQGSTTVTKINGTALSGLATGILKNTTGTGVPSIAVAGDFPTLNQNTTGTASGNLVKNAGDLNEATFAPLNNTASQTITGFAFANATTRSFEALVSVYINATTSLYEVFTIRGIQRGSDWVIATSSAGDNSLVSFAITNAGQMQVTTPSYAGFTSAKLSFRAMTTSV